MNTGGFSSALDRLRQALTFVGALAIGVTMLLILADVILRKIGTPIPGVYEVVVNYLMPAAAFLPLMQVEKSGQMITVEILGAVGGATVQEFLGRFAAAVSLAVYVALAYTTLTDAMNQYRVGSYLIAMDIRLPTWPAYFFLPVAFGAAALVTAQRLVAGAPAPSRPLHAE